MRELRIRKLAQQDIQEIVDYYDAIAPHITDRFLDRLYKSLDTIKSNPFLFQIKYNNTRVRYLQGFRFGIHYITENDIVEILAVLHTSRDPKNWTERG